MINLTTCQVLARPFLRQDIQLLVKCSLLESRNETIKKVYEYKSFEFHQSRLNHLGYLPVISTLTGSGRALLGLVYCIAHLSKPFFTSALNDQDLEEAALGAQNFARGLIEMVPVIGNIAVYLFDDKRCAKLKRSAENEINGDNKFYINSVTLFEKGKASITTELKEFSEFCIGFAVIKNKLPVLNDQINFMRKNPEPFFGKPIEMIDLHDL